VKYLTLVSIHSVWTNKPPVIRAHAHYASNTTTLSNPTAPQYTF